MTRRTDHAPVGGWAGAREQHWSTMRRDWQVTAAANGRCFFESLSGVGPPHGGSEPAEDVIR